MARHKFDGVWRFFSMGHALGSSLGRDGELDVRKDAGDGDLLAGSKLRNTLVTGKITGDKLEFDLPMGGGVKSRHKGKLFFDEGGFMIITGVFNKLPTVAAGRKKGKKPGTKDQDDGTWTGVKP